MWEAIPRRVCCLLLVYYSRVNYLQINHKKLSPCPFRKEKNGRFFCRELDLELDRIQILVICKKKIRLDLGLVEKGVSRGWVEAKNLEREVGPRVPGGWGG